MLTRFNPRRSTVWAKNRVPDVVYASLLR